MQLIDIQKQELMKDNILSEEESERLSEIPLANLPPPEPIPEWFKRRLIEIGGFIPGSLTQPLLRVVWGQDESNCIFAAGQMRMKYPMVVDHVKETTGYILKNLETGVDTYYSIKKAQEKFMSPNGQMTKDINPKTLLLPVIKAYDKEYGWPFWYIEKWISPKHFGTASEWRIEQEAARRQFGFDMIGDFPLKGAYQQLLEVADYNDNNEPCYRSLDEDVLLQVQTIIDYQRRHEKKTQDQYIAEQEKKREDEYDKRFEAIFDDTQMQREKEDIFKHKHSIILTDAD